MSDDLVRRLRDVAHTYDEYGVHSEIELEAAAKIRRLNARVTELEGLLYEARCDLAAFIEHAHPHRKKYPHIMRDFENDVEIVQRIDAVLQRGKKDE